MCVYLFQTNWYLLADVFLSFFVKAAGLEIVADVLETQAVLIANPNAEHKDLVELVKHRLDGYITATKYVLIMYNVSNTLLQDALKITPGKRSATITSLDDGESKAVSSLVLLNDTNRIMDELHNIGATDILVMEIKNSRM
jgi:ATP phosphoribosyltransferase